MVDFDFVKSIAQSSPERIVLLVIDGLGGLPHPETGKTELETARTPNLDKLAAAGISGLCDPVGAGITPGSAPGHLALFGYDPVRFNIGRGALEAVGVDFDLQPGDVAVRANFCTVDKAGLVTDRRAGRIATEQSAELCQRLDGQVIDNVHIMVRPVREHRFIVVFRGDDLSPDVNDSDPLQTGLPPRVVATSSPSAVRLAGIANQFVARARETLAGRPSANMVLLRGFSRRPHFPAMGEIYRLKPAAIAAYPMYRGLARLVGMEVLETGATLEDEIETLRRHYDRYDFFFLHVKEADLAGEDGDFERKVLILEQIDGALSGLIDLAPDVLVITGDHSTPAVLKGHSWHPVPVLLHSKWCRADHVTRFSEPAGALGGLGRFPATQLMLLAMAHARKLTKFGA